MIGSNFTEKTREAWITVPGRYFLEQNNENGDPVKITFYDGENIVFAQYFTYDSNGSVIKGECKSK